ncbi:hypothetical protein D9758_004239 [Tetrapyrgos nigripes]|uniref:Uncharacterized protein n=1 Tax=Tetrapyrgos nigripes TaxID=182062 RepID=A0A8H5LVW4_9AGAR|nr:hypothetical protein D9758_004239 [Tetrapyrgos nigripes]
MSNLVALRAQLQTIYDSIAQFQPPPRRLPILDSSLEFKERDGPWIQHENIPGLKKLKETVKVDLDALDKFLRKNPNLSQHVNSLCTNAPYLLAVWDQVLSAPPPVQIVFKTFPLERSVESDEIDGPIDENSALTEWEQRERREQKRQKREKGKEDGQEKDQQRPPGVKVDVVADYGRRWIRVNTIKNSRLLAEFREIDSYLTDSSDEEFSDEEADVEEKHADPNYRPTLAAKEFDNSLLRMGRALMRAAKINPVRIPSIRKDKDSSANITNANITIKLSINDVSYTSINPHVTLRLTRLDPDGLRGPTDARIGETVRMLKEMGLEVVLGECELERATATTTVTKATEVKQPSSSLPLPEESKKKHVEDWVAATATAPVEPVSTSTSAKSTTGTGTTKFPQPIPTHKVNLDLSILLALVSDLTHAALPTSVEEAKKRFAVMEGGKYAEWKKAVAKEKEREKEKEQEEKKKEGKPKRTKATSNKTRNKKKANSRVQEDSIDTDTEGDGDDDFDLDHDHDLHEDNDNDNDEAVSSSHPSHPVPYITDLAKQTRALTNQVLQEMSRGLLEEMTGRLGLGPTSTSAPRSGSAFSTSTSTAEEQEQQSRIEFWTTPEARDRCLRIVEKIGGPEERRRARALLWMPPSSRAGNKTASDGAEEKENLNTLAQAEEAYWQDSRYGHKYLPLLPLSFYPCNSVDDVGEGEDARLQSQSQLQSSSISSANANVDAHQTQTLPPFFLALDKACSDTLEQEMAKGRWYTKYTRGYNSQQNQNAGDRIPYTSASSPNESDTNSTDIPKPEATATKGAGASSSAPSAPLRTILTKVSPRLTPHTVQSLRWGARLGWTTLTANRTSVKAIVKEVGARRRFLEALQIDGGTVTGTSVEDGAGAGAAEKRDDNYSNLGLLGTGGEGQGRSRDPSHARQNQMAAIWIVDPRSLAEGMRADLDSFNAVAS